MTLERFFEKFDVFADVPGAVGKVRELVLKLAVRGKLNDSPLSAGVPTTIESVVKLISGQHQLADEQNQDRKGLPYLTGPADFGSKYPTASRWTESPKVTAESGDILITVKGAGVGKTNLVDVGPVAISRQLMAIRVVGASTAFVHLVLQNASDHFQGAMTGIAIPGIGRDDVLSLKFVLPPLAEQKRIVAKVDELMALCDRWEVQLKDKADRNADLAKAALARFTADPTPGNLEYLFHEAFSVDTVDLRKTILTLAVRGKLVEQQRQDVSAQTLLQTIEERKLSLFSKLYPNPAEARTQAKKHKEQKIPADLHRLPFGWSWATLLQASLLVIDCHNKTAPYKPAGVRLIRTTNIRNGVINSLDPKYVDETTYLRWSARCFPEPGDLLITREAPMGEACIIPNGMRICLGQRVMLIRLVEQTVDRDFLLLSLMEPGLMDRVQDKPVGATVKHLRVGGVETLLVPLPPLAEQKRIVAKVDELMALVDQLEALQTEARNRGVQLLEAAVEAVLNAPTEDVPRDKVPKKLARAVLSAEIVHRLHAEPTFGRVKHQKLLFLCEHAARLPEIEGNYHRDVAGPLDNDLLYANEAELEAQGWYSKEARESSKGHRYHPLAGAGGHRAVFHQLWAGRREIIDRLIDTLHFWDTEKCELLATLFAAWNDLILWGRPVTDDVILVEVLERWNASKTRFSRERWLAMLGWMKAEGWVPTGFGRPTDGEGLGL